MSIVSGKCDLLDHISGMGGWFDKDGNPVTFGQEHTYVYYSDILKDFEAFKEATGGVVYQHHNIKIKSWFRDEQFDFIKEHCNGFNYKCLGEKNKITDYSFSYYDRTYTYKELNKKGGVYIEVPIHFNTLLDLLPYLPYIISMMSSSEGKQHVVISSMSYVDEEHELNLDNCCDSLMFDRYKKELSDLYTEVCKNYFLYKLEERTRVSHFSKLVYAPLIKEDGNCEKHVYIEVDEPIDYMHDIEFVWADSKKHINYYHSSPKLINEHIIEINENDVEMYLKDKVMIKYVVKPKEGFPVHLN